jgi:hypothetical protein
MIIFTPQKSRIFKFKEIEIKSSANPKKRVALAQQRRAKSGTYVTQTKRGFNFLLSPLSLWFERGKKIFITILLV